MLIIEAELDLDINIWTAWLEEWQFDLLFKPVTDLHESRLLK